MITHSSLRNEYGRVYITYINDNLIVPWKSLSIEDFFEYDFLFKQGLVVPSVLEDEIFKKCVVASEVKNNIENLPAGTVSTVVSNIIQASGPLSIDDFNSTLDSSRGKAQEPLHNLVALIARAFPGYKPEDVYNLPYETFMLRLAQAENLLMREGIVKEPISLVDENSKKKKKRRPDVQPDQLKNLWEKQQPVKQPPPTPPSPKPIKDETFFRKVDLDKPTFLTDSGTVIKNKGIINDRVSIEQAVGSEELNEERAAMVKQIQSMYEKIFPKLDFYNNK